MGLKSAFEKIKKKNPILGSILLLGINPYIFITLVFVIWMLFFDGNSYLVHRELNKEKEKLEGNKEYFIKEINQDESQIAILKDSVALERFAREEYFMKKEKEEIYIIEYQDSIPKEDD